jgi:hypothetical protein
MLTSDKLILVELHKAGSARLKKLLGDLVGGETSGKHASYSDELASLGKPVVGYICNPLTWYLAQWKLGCTGKGDIHKRLTDETKWDLLHSKRATRPLKEGSKADAKAIPEGWGAERAKTFWYADASNPEAFREWLQAIAVNRGLRRLVDHGYANSPINRLAGLLTYQFFLMFVRGAENMEKSVDSVEALQARHAQAAITSHFIRSDAISADLLKVLDAVGVKLNAEQRAAIDSLKERSGAEEAAILRYYDAASLRVVAKREAFLNQLFDYGPPTAGARTGARAAAKGDKPDKSAAEGRLKKAKGEGPKLSKAEKEQKRQARAKRQAAKEKKAARTATADAKSPVNGDKPASTQADAPKPAKTVRPARDKAERPKRVKSPPAADDDLVDNEA